MRSFSYFVRPFNCKLLHYFIGGESSNHAGGESTSLSVCTGGNRIWIVASEGKSAGRLFRRSSKKSSQFVSVIKVEWSFVPPYYTEANVHIVITFLLWCITYLLLSKSFI